MRQGKFIELGVGAACVALVSLAWAQPKEMVLEGISCYGGTGQNYVVNTPTERYGTFVLSGVFRASTPGGNGDGNIFECSGMLEFRGGAFNSLGYCVVADKDGHHFYTRDVGSGGRTVVTVVGGTGKYAGASGSGTRTSIAGVPPIRAGQAIGCNQGSMTIKLL